MKSVFQVQCTFIKGKYNVSSDKKPLAAQFSDEICNILRVFHVLTGFDYVNPFYRRSKFQSFERIFLKLELTALIQFLKVPNTNFLEVTDFGLHVTYNQPSNEKASCDARYPMLFFKNKNKIFNNIKSLLPDQRSLNMKIL